MYFPYLRGKQFDLIAVRELVEEGKLHEDIIPLIEPVNASSTLLSTIQAFIDNQHEIAIIGNPQVGNFSTDIQNADDYKLELKTLLENEFVIESYIIEDEISSSPEIMGNDIEDYLIILNNKSLINEYRSMYENNEPRYLLTPYERQFRRLGTKDNKVIISDPFNKLDRNADYLDAEADFFSDEHIYITTEDSEYTGFSDFSTIGAEYFDSGFAPYAVAIHVVYLEDDDTLHIKHFASETNDSIEDPALKFYEANEKLYRWADTLTNPEMETLGLGEFKRLYEEEKYSGLGVVKKLSIQHHIELLTNYFNRGE